MVLGGREPRGLLWHVLDEARKRGGTDTNLQFRLESAVVFAPGRW
jgi:hypothetical protein